MSPLAEPYLGMTVIDAHNHDASGMRYVHSMLTWDKYAIDKIVLFGDVSEPSAQTTDAIAYNAFRENPDRFILFIAGIDIFDPACIDYITERFKAGAAGIGEIIAASTASPMTSKLPWKGKDPWDGFLPHIYDLCAKYKKPILLHIDPPDGFQTARLIEAAVRHPGTNFIFAHANAYSSPGNIEKVLTGTKNIYIDFFAGFTAFNPASNCTLADYVPLIKAYPDRFMVSTDSGYDIGYDNAYTAIYQLFDLLERDVVVKIAGKNIERLIYPD